jgi:hypothetical protein
MTQGCSLFTLRSSSSFPASGRSHLRVPSQFDFFIDIQVARSRDKYRCAICQDSSLSQLHSELRLVERYSRKNRGNEGIDRLNCQSIALCEQNPGIDWLAYELEAVASSAWPIQQCLSLRRAVEEKEAAIRDDFAHGDSQIDSRDSRQGQIDY